MSENYLLFPELEKPETSQSFKLDLTTPQKPSQLRNKLKEGKLSVDSLSIVFKEKNFGLSTFTYLDRFTLYDWNNKRPTKLFYIAHLPDSEILKNEFGLPYSFTSKEKAQQFLIDQFASQIH